MKKTAVIFLSLFIFICSLPSCSPQKEIPSCREMLLEVTHAEIGLPAGKFYSSKAQKGDSEYLSSTLIASLFGGGSYPAVAEDWIEVALYLSVGNHPCEFAVILCQNRDAAHDTAKLFCSRLSAIKITKNSAEYENMITNAKVAVSGNFALLIISSDPENALKIIQKKIGKY